MGQFRSDHPAAIATLVIVIGVAGVLRSRVATSEGDPASRNGTANSRVTMDRARTAGAGSDPMASGRRLQVFVVTCCLSTDRNPLGRKALQIK
jgi:hypothetical protein